MEARKEGKKTQFQQPFNTLLATKALVTMSVLFFLDLPRSISNAGISVQAEPSNITLAAAVGPQWPCIAGEAVVVGCNQFDVDRQEVSLFVVVAAKISCELILQLSPEAAAPGETVCAAAKIIWVGKNW